MNDPVRQAIDEIGSSFTTHKVVELEDGQGGAFVIVEGIAIGEQFSPSTTWIGQAIAYTYPDSDVYPHWLDPGVRLASGDQLPAGLSANQTMPGFQRPAVQVSRRSNRWDPNTDTAALKLLKVIKWLHALT